MISSAWPVWLKVASIEFGMSRAVEQSRSPVTQFLQSVDLLAWRWNASVTLPARLPRDAGAVEAVFTPLVGGVEAIEIHHFNRPVPLGSMRGAPQLSAAAAQFTNVFSIQAVAGATVRAGDMLGFGGQLFQVRYDAVANDAGLLAIVTVNRTRSSLASGLAVTWNRPSAKFVMADKSSKYPHLPGRMDPVSFEFEEVP